MVDEIVRESGWEKWHDWQSKVMAPVVEWYCEATRVRAGQVVLDVACGTGLPAIALAERVRPGGKVVATDVSSVMLGAIGRKAQAAGLDNLETREMHAAALDFPDATFDVVTCKDGLMYCDPIEGARELRRVLAPGGRFAVSAWDVPEHNAFFTTLFDTLGRFVPGPLPSTGIPGPFRLAPAGELERVLRAAGFGDIAIETRDVVFEVESIERHWELIHDTAAPVAAAAASLSATEHERFRQALAEALAPYLGEGRLRLPNRALCASGSR